MSKSTDGDLLGPDVVVPPCLACGRNRGSRRERGTDLSSRKFKPGWDLKQVMGSEMVSAMTQMPPRWWGWGTCSQRGPEAS